MDIYVFSNSKTIEKCFASASKSKDYSFSFLPASDLKKTIKNAAAGSCIYTDISSFPDAEAGRIIKFLAKLEDHRIGIVDPKGSIKDIASLFHDGSADYIGKELFKTGVSAKRLKQSIEFKEMAIAEPVKAPAEVKKAKPKLKKGYKPSGKDWKNVVAGQEYTFTFMLIELDNKKELKAFGDDVFKRIVQEFHDYVEEIIAPQKGRIWMWMDFGGCVLFPFDGKNCNAIITGLRLMLNRRIMGSEVFEIDIMPTIRIAIHIGNSVYKKRGDTGTIVSDSINSVFHLGQKFGEPGNYYLTEDAAAYIPDKMRDIFVSVGEYEGREIMKLKTLS